MIDLSPAFSSDLLGMDTILKGDSNDSQCSAAPQAQF